MRPVCGPVSETLCEMAGGIRPSRPGSLIAGQLLLEEPTEQFNRLGSRNLARSQTPLWPHLQGRVPQVGRRGRNGLRRKPRLGGGLRKRNYSVVFQQPYRPTWEVGRSVRIPGNVLRLLVFEVKFMPCR